MWLVTTLFSAYIEGDMELTYSVKLDSGAKYTTHADSEMKLKTGDTCIIRKDYYQDYGTVTQVKGEFKAADFKEEIPQIIRKSDFHDKSKAHENIMRAKSAFRTAEQFVDQLNLKMKLLNAHYTFDKKLIMIQFTADGRVDFRELVKQLTQSLNARVELRQIGVRDETAIIGGLGVCGQELCCSRYLKSFASINVKMAKDQDLSLNPSSISGICGRLKCCLKYEHEGYKLLQKEMPRKGERCDTVEGEGKIVDRNLLSQIVVVRLQDTSGYASFHKSEIALGGGKVDKTPEQEREIELRLQKLRAKPAPGRSRDKKVPQADNRPTQAESRRRDSKSEQPDNRSRDNKSAKPDQKKNGISSNQSTNAVNNNQNKNSGTQQSQTSDSATRVKPDAASQDNKYSNGAQPEKSGKNRNRNRNRNRNKKNQSEVPVTNQETK